MKHSLFAFLALILFFPFASCRKAEQEVTKDDWKALEICRSGMEGTLRYLDTGAFRAKKLLSSDQRRDLRDTWKGFLDYVCALDAMGQGLGSSKASDALDALSYAVFLSQYRHSLEFLKQLEKVPGADKLLNEAMPEWGLQERSLAAFKLRFLHVAQAGKFTAFQVAGKLKRFQYDAAWAERVKKDEEALWKMGVGKGTAMTVENGADILKAGVFQAWFPTQKGVANWMGDTKVWRVKRDQHLISKDQMEALKKRLQPGDILFTRHEWYLSNLGLPGFWSHAALYVGDPDTRRIFFNTDEVRDWIREQGALDFEDLLRRKHPEAHKQASKGGLMGDAPRILEAIGEGVVLTTLEHFAEADSLSAIRPRLSKVEKARAVLRAFGYTGRPYDFNFDFQSDDTLVCSEVVYKAYEPAGRYQGLKFPLQTMAGRVVSSPNGMVEQFDAQYGKREQQCDLAAFLDGREKKKEAVEPGVGEFRKSWQRPKWNVFLQ